VPTPVDSEALIRTVTEAVLARLGVQAGRAPRRVLLLLPMASRGLPGLGAQVAELIRRGHRVTVLAAASVAGDLERLGLRGCLGTEVLTVEAHGLTALLAELSGRDWVVLGSLGFSLARALLSRDDRDPFVRLICQALLCGGPVSVLPEDLKSDQAAARSPLVLEGAGLLKELAGMGIALVPAGALARTALALESADGTISREAGTLVSEEDVLRLHQAGEKRLVVGHKTLLTPLARGRAVELGLEIQVEET
jgi:hypothetical protein